MPVMSFHVAKDERSKWKRTTGEAWLVVSATGETLPHELSQESIMQRAGLRPGDLRIINPLLHYPPKIITKEQAIVVNLQHIKVVIKSNEALVVNSKDILVSAFARELQSQLATSHQNPSPVSIRSVNVTSKDGGANVLPFEFQVIEVCLQSTCTRLESEASMLKQEAYPALDRLTKTINKFNLERVRDIKTRLLPILGHVQKVKDELQQLDDRIEMAKMYLTAKLDSQPDGEGKEAFKTDIGSSRDSLDGFKPNIDQLEMLLEAYYMQIDGTLKQLLTLSEAVDEAEDYIKIRADIKQNSMLQMGIVLSIAILVLDVNEMVAGLLGMNIAIGFFKDPAHVGFWDFRFWTITAAIVVNCIVMFTIAIRWGQKSGVLR